jgi:hypothetical protein
MYVRSTGVLKLPYRRPDVRLGLFVEGNTFYSTFYRYAPSFVPHHRLPTKVGSALAQKSSTQTTLHRVSYLTLLCLL